MSRAAVTLVEVLVALTILSTIMIPVGMFMSQTFRGSADLTLASQVLNLLETTLEEALNLPFARLPVGTLSNMALRDEGGTLLLDLNPHEVGGEPVALTLEVEMAPVTLNILSDPATGDSVQKKLAQSLKRLHLIARWGKEQQHALDLGAWKADL